MTRIQERHRLDALLAQGLDCTQPADFVELLAAYGVETDEALRARAIERLKAGLPGRDELERWLDGVEISMPSDWHGEEAWIVAVETIDLATKAAEELVAILGDDLVGPLKAATVKAALAHEERTWMNPLVAAESRAGSLPEVFPWNQIRCGAASRRLRADGPVSPEVLDAWLGDRLHAEDANALAQWVKDAGSWREAYHARIVELARHAGVPRFDVARSLSVAADDTELELARLVQDLPLPHLGHEARREGRLHAKGTHWQLRDAAVSAEQLVPYEATRLVWSDEVLGELVTELVELPVDDVRLAEDAMVSILRLASGLAHPRARSIALAVTEDLRAGSLHDGLAAAARALDEAQLEAEPEIRWAACALRTQLELERLGHRLADDTLDAATSAAEAALMPHARGLLLLDDDHYRDLTRGYDIDPEAWWGLRERLDEEVPTFIVASALDELAASTPAARGPVVSLAAFRAAVEHDLRTSTPPAERGLRVAAASPRLAGEIDLLVAVEGGERIGRLLRVSVKHGEGDPFEGHLEFAPVARDAIREAYAAAAAACPSGVPPLALEHHKFVVHETLDITSIDGSSLGLAFVLAFASLWLDRPIDEKLAATGRVYRGKGGAWFVGPVDHVPAKAAALFAAEGERGARLMADPEHEAEIRAFDHEPVLVSTVAHALERAGLDLHDSNLAQAWPDQRQRFKAIADLTETIDAQDIEPFAGWGDPWSFLGDRMALLIDSLADEVDERVPRGKVYGALAYVHAGKPKAAAALLRGVSLEHASPEIGVVKRIVELDQAIDEASWDRYAALGTELEGALASVPAPRRGQLAGLALGTRGRALLHAGEPVAALALLEDAVAHQAAHAAHELGRSRVYLANALRNAGRPAEALQTLETAAQDLETHTKPWSRPYFVQCRAYWAYERARLAIAQGDPELALEHAHEAHALVRRQGFWPTLGILRVLAWGYRLIGEPDEAELYVEQIEALDVPPAHHELRDRILAEATGLPIMDGEVY